MTSLSVQLYSVRDAFAADPDGTISRLAEIGFTQMEPFSLTPERAEKLAAPLAKHSIRVPTAHASIIGVDPEPAFAAAKKLGVGTLIDPYVSPEHWHTGDQIRETVSSLTELAAAAKNHGLRVGYHNHDHELSTRIDGVPALEYFAQRLPESVVLEVDTYWVAVGGVDPVGLLERLGERVVAIHIKDGPPSREPADQVAIGSGTLPIAEIVAAAPTALPVAEFDATRGDMFEALAASYAFLKSIGLS